MERCSFCGASGNFTGRTLVWCFSCSSFTLEEGIDVTLYFYGNPDLLIPATMVSLGKGGMGFVASFVATRELSDFIEKGNLIIVNKIQGPEPLGSIENVELAVRYVLDYDIYDHIKFGCEFIKIPPEFKKRIQAYVNERFKKLKEK